MLNLLKYKISTEEPEERMTALKVYEKQISQHCILSYNKELDKILENELLPGTITELTGLPGSGKTHICFQLSITVQFPKEKYGLNGEVLYVDTNNNFASHMIKDFAHKIKNKFHILNSISEEQLLKRIHCANIKDCNELQGFLKYIEKFLSNTNIRLLVIDSMATLLRKLNVKNRTSIIYRIFQNLQSLGQRHNFAILITNDLTTRVNKRVTFTTPSFGDSFYHRVNTRILLTKDGDFFSAKILKSILKPPTEISYRFF